MYLVVCKFYIKNTCNIFTYYSKDKNQDLSTENFRIAYIKTDIINVDYTRDMENDLDKIPDKYRMLGFNRGYIKGMIFDSPAKNSDDYIKPIVAQKEFLGALTKNFVPYAIRISSGEDNTLNLAAEISRMPIPICIIYGGHDVFIGADKIRQIVDERNRLNEKITSSLYVPGAGYLESFSADNEGYCNGILSFLHTYFG